MCVVAYVYHLVPYPDYFAEPQSKKEVAEESTHQLKSTFPSIVSED